MKIFIIVIVLLSQCLTKHNYSLNHDFCVEKQKLNAANKLIFEKHLSVASVLDGNLDLLCITVITVIHNNHNHFKFL